MSAAMADDVLTLWHLVNPRLLVEFTGPTVWNRLPWALLAFGTAVGGLIVVYILVKVILGYCCLPQKYHDRLVWSGVDKKTGESQFIRETRNTPQSYKHVFLETLWFIGVFIVLWIASFVAGFDLLSSSLMSIAIGLIATYMFSVVIQNMGAGYWVYLTDKVEECHYVRSATNPVVHGMIHEMHPLYVILQRENDQRNGCYEIQVPMANMLTDVWIRDFNEEGLARSRMEVDAKELQQEGLLKTPNGNGVILPVPATMVKPSLLPGLPGLESSSSVRPQGREIRQVWKPSKKGVRNALKEK